MIKVSRWNNDNNLDQSQLENSLKKEGLTPYIWNDGIGTFYPSHSHDYTEIRVIIKGSATFFFEGEQVTLNPGDRLEIPANTPHHMKASDEEPTSYLCASK